MYLLLQLEWKEPRADLPTHLVVLNVPDVVAVSDLEEIEDGFVKEYFYQLLTEFIAEKFGEHLVKCEVMKTPLQFEHGAILDFPFRVMTAPDDMDLRIKYHPNEEDKAEQQRVSEEIAKQIGGRAFFMMGTTHKINDRGTLLFNVRGSKTCNKVRVSLERATDTYRVEFIKVGRAPNYKVEIVSTKKGIHVENLRQVLSEGTQLALSL